MCTRARPLLVDSLDVMLLGIGVLRCVKVRGRIEAEILLLLSPIEGLLNRRIEVILVCDFVMLVRGWGLVEEDGFVSC